jgi:hypothetical protein
VGLLLCWLWRLRTQLIDAALTISNELVAGVLRRARHAAVKEQQRQQKRLGSVLRLCSEVVELILDHAIADTELRAAVFQRWSRDQLRGVPDECRALASPAEQLYMDELRRRYSYVRQFALRLLETFVLRAVVPNEPPLHVVVICENATAPGTVASRATRRWRSCRHRGNLRVSCAGRDRPALVGDLFARPTSSSAEGRQSPCAPQSRLPTLRAVIPGQEGKD